MAFKKRNMLELQTFLKKKKKITDGMSSGYL